MSGMQLTHPVSRTLNVRGPYVSRPISSRRSSTIAAASKKPTATSATEKGEITFQPFEEVQAQLKSVSKGELDAPHKEFARVLYNDECEAAINEQINVEYAISYIYHSFYAYFDRDNVGLPGIAKYFKEQSNDEREHAEIFMEYQNKRGGRVQLHTIARPEVEYNDAEKGEALYAFELALSLEKLNFQKMWELDHVATKADDYEMASFVEEMMHEQVREVKRAAEQVAQLRRVGKGLGVYEFDRQIQG